MPKGQPHNASWATVAYSYAMRKMKFSPYLLPVRLPVIRLHLVLADPGKASHAAAGLTMMFARFDCALEQKVPQPAQRHVVAVRWVETKEEYLHININALST